jgi:hypothetical protein
MAAAGPVMGKYTPSFTAAAAGSAEIYRTAMINASRLMVRPPLRGEKGKRRKGIKEFTYFAFLGLLKG